VEEKEGSEYSEGWEVRKGADDDEGLVVVEWLGQGDKGEEFAG
jgi:hypothetical protein